MTPEPIEQGEAAAERSSIQDQPPNFRGKDGYLRLVFCHVCERENYALAVSSGVCALCGAEAEGRGRHGTESHSRRS